MTRLRRLAVRLALVLGLSGAAPLFAWAQSTQPRPAADEPSGTPTTAQVTAVTETKPAAQNKPSLPIDPDLFLKNKPPLPFDVDRIKEEVDKQPAVKLDDHQLRFYVLVLGKTPQFRFTDFVGNYDLKNGPTKGGAAMTHQEFLNMVTPKELNELFGATSSSSFAMFQAAVMNAAGQALLKKAVQEIRQARDANEVQTIRERIDQELAALLGKDK